MEGRKKAGVGIALAGIAVGGVLIIALTRKAEAHPGDIVLSDLILSPDQVYVGEPVEISLVATNVGGEQATREIICEVLW